MNEEEIIIYLTNQNKKLKEEICSLKNKIKEIDNTRAYWHIKNDDKKDKIKQLKDIRETAINYIDQVIMYKPCAREIDKELDILIGILRGGNNE